VAGLEGGRRKRKEGAEKPESEYGQPEVAKSKEKQKTAVGVEERVASETLMNSWSSSDVTNSR
jgi:hypothetical protein